MEKNDKTYISKISGKEIPAKKIERIVTRFGVDFAVMVKGSDGINHELPVTIVTEMNEKEHAECIECGLWIEIDSDMCKDCLGQIVNEDCRANYIQDRILDEAIK